MNVEISHEGSDITNSVISYQREQEICNGVATLRLIRVDNGRDFTTWDEVVLYEEGTKKGKFYVKSVSVTHEGEMQVELQDASMRLMDYFVPENSSYSYVTTTRFWIEKYLNEVGLDYQFTTSTSGAPVAPNSTFGYSSAYDLVVQMLQMSNWYFYINANGRAIIGSLTVTSGHPSETFHDNSILGIQTNTNDKMLRNRAVVWGAADIINGGWVFADITIQTRYNYDSRDERAIVFSSHYIETYSDAYRIASQMLNEFNRITQEKTVIVVGGVDVEIGDYVFIQSEFFHGGGLVTAISSSVSDSGFITTLVLDQRCPRIFGFYSDYDDYVYIGTYLDGVWRKMFSGDIWSDFSTGITDLGITDLSINNGVFATTTNSGLAYYRYITGGSWINFSPNGSYYPAPSGMAEIFPSGLTLTSGIYASCCTVDRINNYIYYGFTTNSGVLSSGYLTSGLVQYTSGYSWVVTLASNGAFYRSDLITISGLDPSATITITDIDNNGTENLLVCQVSVPVEMLPSGVLFNQGYYENTLNLAYNLGTLNYNYRELDPSVFIIGPMEGVYPDDVESEQINLGYTGSVYDSPIVVFGEEVVAFFRLNYTGASYKLYEVYMNEFGSAFVEQSWDIADVGDYVDSTSWKPHALFKKEDSTDYILVLTKDVSNTRYYTILSIGKSGEVSLIAQKTLYIGTFDLSGQRLGEFEFSATSVGYLYQDDEAKDHRAVAYYAGAINMKTGATFDWDVYWDDKDTPVERYGADIAHSQYAVFVQDSDGNPVLRLISVGTMEREFDVPTCQSDINQLMYCLTIFPSMNTDFRLIDSVFSVSYTPCSEGLTITPYGSHIIGYDMYKMSARWEYKVGWEVGSDGESTRTVNLVLPTLIDIGDNFYPGEVDVPLSVRVPYDFIHLATVDHEYDRAYLFHDDTFVCELEIPVDDTFPDTKTYTFLGGGFAVNADINDDTIYGIVIKSNTSNEYGTAYFCGWNRNGELTKRFYTWLSRNSTNFIGSPIMFNQFALIPYGTTTVPNKYLFVRFFYPSDNSYLWGSQITVIRQEADRSQFVPIHVSTYPIHVDTSKSAPTLINTYQAMSGEWSSQGYMGVNWTNLAGEFNTVFSNFPIADARTFDIGNPSGFVVESGVVSISGFRYIALVNSGGMFFMDATLYDPNITTIATISGMATVSGIMASGIGTPSGLYRLEITNYSVTTPYFFAASPSGFWQRNPGMAYFTDYSAGLPSSAITIIRADDRV